MATPKKNNTYYTPGVPLKDFGESGSVVDRVMNSLPIVNSSPRTARPMMDTSAVTKSKVERVQPFVAATPTLRTTVLGDKLKSADTMGAAQDQRLAPRVGKAISKGLGKVGSAVKPEFLSNVANELIGPTGPRTPNLMSNPRPIAKVNMDATRAAIQSSESAIGRGADQSVDGNTANAVRLGARAQSLTALNSVAENEAQANTRVDMANAQSQTQTDYVNTGIMNKYQDDLQELGNTRKSQKLGNLANFADKIVAGKNLEATQGLEREKLAILGASFDPGVTQRARDLVTGALGKKFKKGGKLKQYAL